MYRTTVRRTRRRRRINRLASSSWSFHSTVYNIWYLDMLVSIHCLFFCYFLALLIRKKVIMVTLIFFSFEYFLFLNVYDKCFERGIMQDHYERISFQNIPNAQLQLSFTGTLMEIMIHIMGIPVQLLSARYGVKFVLALGTLLTTLGLELAAFSTEVCTTPF